MARTVKSTAKTETDKKRREGAGNSPRPASQLPPAAKLPPIFTAEDLKRGMICLVDQEGRIFHGAGIWHSNCGCNQLRSQTGLLALRSTGAGQGAVLQPRAL